MSYYQKAVIQMLKTGTVDGSLNWKYTRPSLWTCEIHNNIECKIGTNQYQFTNIKMTVTVDSIGIMISFPESGINQDNNDMNGKVLFRNKEKIAYSSLYIIDRRKFILFDRMTKRIRVKRLGTEDITNKYVFINSCLKDLCCILDDSITLGHINCLRKLKSFRHEYINSTNPEIYRSVDNHNKFKYMIDNQIEYSDIYLKESDNCHLMKDDNYMNYIMPLMRSFI